MAPMPKRAHEEEVNGDPKRARTEDEEDEVAAEEASGSDEDASDDGLGELEDASDFDDGDDPEDDEEFTKEDFTDLEVTDEQLEAFKQANVAWHKQLLEKEEADGMVSMVIGSVVDLRPIAQTVEDLEKGMTVLLIPRAAHEKADQHKKAIGDVLSSIEDEDQELSDEEELALLRSICGKQADLLITFLEEAKARVEKKELEGLWADCVVLTNVVFDDDVHQLFSDVSPESGKKVLAVLKGLWQAVLAVAVEDLKISAADRKATLTMLRLCKEDLQAGSLQGNPAPEDEEERPNPFAEPDFDFE